MKNYTITVNGNVYDVTVEENGAGGSTESSTEGSESSTESGAAPKAPAKSSRSRFCGSESGSSREKF